jgi:hypothetical protein
MGWRDKPRRERMSDRLRRTTEARWEEDRFLSSAGGGGCDGWDRDDDHSHGWDDGQDYEGEEFV